MNMKINLKPKAVLYQWKIVPSDVNRQDIHLQGLVYGHPRFPRGKQVITSRVLRLDITQELAETENTIYLLTSGK